MKIVKASRAKQNFGEILALAAFVPQGIERHGKLVAALVPPDWLAQQSNFDERRAARAAQQQIEKQRLMAHQALGIALLCATDFEQRSLLHSAMREVDRWQAGQLCSADYITRWRQWLALPIKQLVQRMCSDAAGWGNAMRQNSPFIPIPNKSDSCVASLCRATALSADSRLVLASVENRNPPVERGESM